MTADRTDTGDRQGREALREAVRDILAHWPIGSGYYSTSVGNDEALEMADAVLAALTPTDEEPREDSSGAREGHPGNAGEPADVAASRRALIDGRAAILREWAKIGSGRERWTDDMLAAAAVAALGMDGWLAAAPSVPGPAPADEDGLRREIERLHQPRRVQTGSLTHGGGPQYGEICRRDAEPWPCQERRALDRTAAPATDQARPEATP